MALILTFLGRGSTSRTKIAIATAKKFASQGKRTLLAGGAEPAMSTLLGTSLSTEATELSPNLQAVQFQTGVLLEKGWEEVKKLEAQYLRTPILKEVFGQELAFIPGLESALALNAIRQYDQSGKYDVIIYDGAGDSSTLRMVGLSESLSWYVRRFRQLFANSDLGRSISESPLIQPLVSSFFNINWTSDNFSQPANLANNFLDQAKVILSDPKRVAAFLVTSDDPVEVATARYLWGASQQVDLTVGGVIKVGTGESNLSEEFAPLNITNVAVDNWQGMMDALPDFATQAIQAPKPIEIDINARQVRLFLPGFDKKQVKLTQYGPEVTIEAGDQRRNIALPPALSGKPVTGAKFQNSYLIISF
jgi:anion-transporting  ArsA/GET3 family ATPase